MDKKNWIAFIVIGGLFGGVIIWRNINQSNLKKYGVIVEARIERVNIGGKVSGGFQCAISYKDEKKEMPSPSSIKKGNFYFVGKTFPAMYLPETNTLEILITPVDFEKFNIPFPDSLKWVTDYLYKN